MTDKTKDFRRLSSEVIYTPESRLRQPALLLKEMWNDVLASRELAWHLMLRDIRAQYRQSFLGYFWAFVPAIAFAAGFTLASNAKIINIGPTALPYPAYVMFSMTLWQTFVEALNAPVQAVVLARPMLARINFPREAIIFAKLGEVFFSFGIKLILIVVVFVWFQISVSWNVFLAPLALLSLVLFGTFVGVLLAPLGGLYQDVSKGLLIVTGFWLFLTPVVFPVPGGGTFGMIVKLNPVTHLLVTTRELATTGAVSDPVGFWVVSIVALAGLGLAWVIYRIAMPYVIERVGS